MRNLVSTEKIDNLIDFLYKQGSEYIEYRRIIKEHFHDDEKGNDIEGMLIKLEDDKMVDVGTFRNGETTGWGEQKIYKLSFGGRIRYEKTPFFSRGKIYRYENIKGSIRIIWQITKIVVIALNAAMILFLMWKAIPQNS